MKKKILIAMILFLVVAALFDADAAQAGSWTRTYYCSGVTIGFPGSDEAEHDPGTIVYQNWPSVVGGDLPVFGTFLSSFPYDSTMAFDFSDSEATSSGSVQAVFVWHPDSSSDMPPRSLEILESSGEVATGTFLYLQGTFSTGFSDGHGDGPYGQAGTNGGPQIKSFNSVSQFKQSVSPDLTYSAFYSAYGIHVTSYPVTNDGGVYEVKLPQRSISVSASPAKFWTNPYNGSFQVGVTYDASLLPFEGDSTVNTAYWDPYSPRFFSGTRCGTLGTAITPYPLTFAGVDGISKAQICITDSGNDVVIKEADTTSWPYPDTVSLAGLFDSTHFVPGSNITLKLKVWGLPKPVAYGVTGAPVWYYEGDITGKAVNKFYGWGNDTLPLMWTVAPPCLDGAVQAVLSMNYDQKSTDTADKPTICKELPYYTCLFATSHGLVGQIAASNCDGDDNLLPDGTSQYWITNFHDPSVPSNLNDFPSQLHIKQSDLNIPPYNFVDWNACQFGSDISCANCVGILTTLPEVDRAVLGWQDEIRVDQLLIAWNFVFWNCLRVGRTVYDASVIATAQGPVTKPNPTGYWPRSIPTVPIIYGDPLTKLHGVYGGHDDSSWELPL